MDLEQRGFQAEWPEADNIATSQRDGRVVEQTAVDVRAVFSAEISQNETASITVVLDNRMAVIDRLTLRYISTYNKSAESNLGRGPRRGAVAHVRRKVPIGCNGAPQNSPPKVLLPVDGSPKPASCLEPSDLWCQTACGSDPPFFDSALDRPTDRRTYVEQTDREIVHGKVWRL